MKLTSISDVSIFCAGCAGLPMLGLMLFSDHQARYAGLQKMVAEIDATCWLISECAWLVRTMALKVIRRRRNKQRWAFSEAARIWRQYREGRSIRLAQARRMAREG